jgi:UTP:GlnB (protein PII) uridylyltransferase
VKLSEWLVARTPRPPEALLQRINAALGAALDHDVVEGRGRTHEELLAAARSLLCIGAGCEDEERKAAHDLLAADALATYAFEIAAEDPDAIDSLAESAMRDFGALAREGSS